MNKFSLLIFVFLSGITFSQEFGFLGKKNIVSFYGTANPRVVSGFFIGSNSGDGGFYVNKYKEGKEPKYGIKIFRYDFRASYRRLIRRNMAIGAELGYERLNVAFNRREQYANVPNDPNLNNDSYYLESPQFNVFSYMLVIDLIGDADVPPMGFSSSFGIGPKFYSFNHKKTYHYAENGEIINPFPYYEKNMMALDIFCDFSYKIPISRVLAFDIGMRLRTGYLFRRSDSAILPNDLSNMIPYQWTKESLYNNLRAENLANLVNLKMGFSFIL